jgi:putative solute:sodium symporter small subunit
LISKKLNFLLTNLKEIKLETNKDYNFSLFKPKSEYNRRVRNIIVSIIVIWAFAVFGFQILLLIFQKPTPEKAYVAYELVWEKIKAGNATAGENKEFITAVTSVLGKSSLKKDKRTILSNVLSRNFFNILDSVNREAFLRNIQDLKSGRENLGKATTDEKYLLAKESIEKSKIELLNQVKNNYGFAPNSLEANIIASNLTDVSIQQSSGDELTAVPDIMKLYLIHNQSFLTDFKFLGFPFHYFYTAEFLLILFILLSLLYSIRIERLQKRFKIVE